MLNGADNNGRILALFIRILLLFNSNVCALSAINVPPLDSNIKLKSDFTLIKNLTRQHDGDIFIANGTKCNVDTCVGLSSGTAIQYTDIDAKSSPSSFNTNSPTEICGCRCLPNVSTFREDLRICVDDFHECSLSPFTSGSSSEKIPFVFLPMRGQIIFPSREISFSDIRTPVCAVTGSQYLTKNGWMDLRNPIDADIPFRMFRDEGRTFLQWLGESDLRNKMQGRLILIHLMCRDMFQPSFNSTINKTAKTSSAIGIYNIFTPCVAFRVNGSPLKYAHNVSEVLFQSETSGNHVTLSDGMSTKEYVVIGICSLLLGLIYVASVFLYLHVKKRKTQVRGSRSSLGGLSNEINYPKNDQVTFGMPFTSVGSSYSGPSIDQRNSQRSQRNSIAANSIMKDEVGIIKNNPLLKHFPNLSDHSPLPSDISNSNLECEEGVTKGDKQKNIQTSVLIHPLQTGSFVDHEGNTTLESSPSPTQDNECLPEENISIVEDLMNEERLETMRAIANVTIRKKLYFNPAYFEPHLLMSPPPAAIEFLSKIREVIAIAKYKMSSKRFIPSLGIIPEEGQPNVTHLDSHYLLQQVTPSENCMSCASSRAIENDNVTAKRCSNCGDKRNTIEKWLESVAIPVNVKSSNQDNIGEIQKSTSPTNSSSQSERSTTPRSTDMLIRSHNISPPNIKPPPIPAEAPKIISHSLKSSTSNVPTSGQDKHYSSPLNDISNISLSVKKHLTTSDVYNNPKFNICHSPALSKGSNSSNSVKSNTYSTKTRMELYDNYSKLTHRGEEKYLQMIRNIKQMPDMVYEALARDYSLQKFPFGKSQTVSMCIPTPDYDSTIEKKIKDIYNCTQSSGPSVPTPDYSTLSKKSLRHYQPDSPIYRRRSPQYLIVDYETDSLERSTTKRKCSNSSSPSSNNSSDLSSQPSPSLSTALPLEEEVEVRNTIYDKIDGFRKDGDSNIKMKVTQTDHKTISQTNSEIAARIKYDTPFHGSMTIEVEHEPLTDLEHSTDSDQFEPDTLDRKPKKHSFCDVHNLSAWSEHMEKSQNFVNSVDEHVNYFTLENMTSLPDFGVNNEDANIINSFQNKVEINGNANNESSLHARPSFGSLREIYQFKAIREGHPRTKLNIIDVNQGKTLTLEAKHTRRQRKIPVGEPQYKKIMPPDVIPSEKNYECSKNLKGWNTDIFSNDSKTDSSMEQTNCETRSNHSESTEVTGVSETQNASEFNEMSPAKSCGASSENKISQQYHNDYSAITSKLSLLRNDYSFNKYLKRKKSLDINYPTKQSANPNIEESTQSTNSNILPECTTINSIQKHQKVQSVFRLEVCQPTNGMQIAMGLRDRTKKTHDLKNAWRKFVSLAASKLSPTSSPTATSKQSNIHKKKSMFTYSPENDGGISSLIDDPFQANSKLYAKLAGNSYYEQRFGSRQDMDSGYMSADSSEAYNRRFYDRYNFKLMSERDHIITVDTIEDNSDCADEQSRHSSLGKITNKNREMQLCGRNAYDKTNPITRDENIANNNISIISEYNSNSDDEPFKSLSCAETSESDEEEINNEELCESGAESVETHSVLYKNIRKPTN